VVFSATGERRREAGASAERFLSGAAAKKVVLHEFRDGFFPYVGAEVKAAFESLKAEVAPDLVLTHQRDDLHQDHRLVSELTWNTFRDHLVLEYEVPKYDADLGAPNVFVPLSQETCAGKVSTIVDCFGSQRGKYWFTEDTFWAMLRLRGVESRSPSGYAEAFHGRKLTWRLQR
jgi:LmbE family N-acetylglucosaminyl deacetylase